MRNLFFFISTCLVSCAMFSCSENGVLEEIDNAPASLPQTRSIEKPEFKVENGCLVFDNSQSFASVYYSLLNKTEEELSEWRSTYKYVSLYDVYEKRGKSIIELDHDCSPVEDLRDVKDPVFASLLNENSMFIVGDTIHKVLGEYVYLIKNESSEILESLKSATDMSSFNVLSKEKHTSKLVVRTRSVYERSELVYSGKKRREHVVFNASVSRPSSAGIAVLYVSMEGKAQKKGLWWSLPFKDEMVWSQIVINGGTFVRGLNPVLGIIPYGTSVKKYNDSKNEITYPLGPSNYVGTVKVSVTFNFCKMASHGDESYTNEYTSL